MLELGPTAQVVGSLLGVLVVVVPIVAGLVLRTRRDVRTEEASDQAEVESRLRAEAVDYQRQLRAAHDERAELERRWERERADLREQLASCAAEIGTLRTELVAVRAEAEMVWARATGVGTDVIEKLTAAIAERELVATRQHEEHLAWHRQHEEHLASLVEVARDTNRRIGGRRYDDPPEDT